MLVAKTGYEPQLRLEAFYTGSAPARITRDGQRLVCPCADEVKVRFERGEGEDGGGAISRPVAVSRILSILIDTNHNTTDRRPRVGHGRAHARGGE